MIPFLALLALGITAAAAEEASCETKSSDLLNGPDAIEVAGNGMENVDFKDIEASFALQANVESRRVKTVEVDEMSCSSLEANYPGCELSATRDDDLEQGTDCHPTAAEIAFYEANCEAKASLADVAEDDLLKGDDHLDDGAGKAQWGRRRRRRRDRRRASTSVCCDCVRKLRRVGMCLDPDLSHGEQLQAFAEARHRHSECMDCWNDVGEAGFFNCPQQIRCEQCTSEATFDGPAYLAQWPPGTDWFVKQRLMYPMTYYGTNDPYLVYCFRMGCPRANNQAAAWCASGGLPGCRNQCDPDHVKHDACGPYNPCGASLTQSTNQSHPNHDKEEDASEFNIIKDAEKPAILEESIVRKSNEC